ncbi:DnaJ-domain-containing protein [Lentinus tigrinus ALCF2SS1-6]|uniref:DnaJ-domain-containing protein n=1 Tax=Lentinus tigrinus ALCF2SS1-6 TaxID=1328759 RepID=A0A5C2S6Y7_9APHY|nr:DnaJ-domain-containing protein [Lentinus tigrinus ALCF2SS1-6]
MPAPTSDVNKHLETLGLGPDDLNEDAIRVAYKKLALRWHPDRHNADPEGSKEKFIEVNEAYKALVHECKKRNKHHWLHKDGDGSSTLRSFWPSSTPSAASSSSSTPSASSSGASCATDNTAKQTEIPIAKPTDPSPAKPTRSTKSTDSPPAKRTDVSSSGEKASSRRAAQSKDARDTRSGNARRSGDRDSSHQSSRTDRSHPRASHTTSAAPKSPRPFKPSNLHPDGDSDTSSEADSLHEHKHRHRHHGKTKKHSLEDEYEFIDLGTPLKPLRSPKPLSTSKDKDWIFPLPLTLEDLCFGAKHRYRVTRTLRADKSSHSHSSSKTQTVQIDVHVSPGWRNGTRIRVPGVGNQRSDGSYQDIVFVVEEVAHPRFTRSGDDIVLPVRVPWADAHSRRPYPSDMCDDDDSILDSEGGSGGGRYRFDFGRWRHHGHEHEREEPEDDEVYVMGLDGEEYTLPIPRTLVEAADGSRIFGAGMPIRKNGRVVGKGDLVIRWEFVFPESEKLQRSRWQTLKDAMHLRFQV